MRSNVVIAAAGVFGLGALISWAVTADIYENKMFEERKQYDDMLRSKTKHIWALQDRLEEISPSSSFPHGPVKVVTEPPEPEIEGQTEFPIVAEPEEEVNSEIVDDDEDDEDENVLPEGETPEETQSRLQELIDRYTADPDAQYDAEIVTKRNLDRETPPFVISRDTYAYDEEGEYFSKISLRYFPREQVLLDDDDSPIDDIPSYVGWRSLRSFGELSEDSDVVFVRNRKMETDFEIIKEEEDPLPLHVRYGMEKEEFRANKAAGLLKLRQEDE